MGSGVKTSPKPQRSMLPFAELVTTTNFSFLRGASHPHEYIIRATELGYEAVGITDRHTLAGVVRADIAAKETKAHLLVGCRLQLLHDLARAEPDLSAENELPFSLVLHAPTKSAYSRMSNLLTTGKLRAPKGRCFLSLEDLEPYHEELLATVLVHDVENPSLGRPLRRLKELFDRDRLSLALTSTYAPKDPENKRHLLSLSKELELPLLATNDACYHASSRRPLQDALTCIRLGCTIRDAGYHLNQNAERHLKTIGEMNHLFRHHRSALTRSVELAERCSFTLTELTYEYPREICPDGKTPETYLRELTLRGCAEQYPQGAPESVKRLIEHELRLIRELNYEKYFLTVYDIVRFARSRGILCQGRGAAANSAVCYVLGITAVDPSQVRLLFERFVSKERNEPPDIDIDFEHERREEVIQYIYAKYGRLRAALTAEVISYRTRSALRDMGKVFGLGEETISALIRIKTRDAGRNIPDEKLVAEGIAPEDPDVRLTIVLAEILRAFPRHLSQHVGGFIISDVPLSDICPIENAAMAERTTIEWDKDDIEHLNMLKIDVLGLGMLTCIRKAFELLNGGDSTKVPLTLHNTPREDPAVYTMISRADTIGVFQIESRAQMAMLPRLRPRCFYDIVIEVAIVRPGPIQGGMVHPYLRRRQGLEPVSYPDDRVRAVLEKTLGVPIFQEQVMELAVVAAGFSAGEADRLRRAMASWRKDANALLKFERRLKEGMRANGYEERFAHQLFEQIKGFGEYGFPQSHSASFALLVYISAWLKCHHPAHFAAALINSLPMGFYQPAQIVQDAKNHGVLVGEVDVNSSEWDCTLEESSRRLRLGMRMVRGLREEEAQKIVEAVRARRRFPSILSLWRASRIRVDQLKLLAAADAFRSMGLDRQQALWQIKKLRDERLPLFEHAEEPEEIVRLPELGENIHVVRDYRTVGLSLKAHPMMFLRPMLDRHRVRTIGELKDEQQCRNGMRILVAGLVLVRQVPGTSNGTLFMTIEDETGMGNLIVWPRLVERFSDVLHDSTFVVAKGKVQRESGVIHLVVEEISDISPHYNEMEFSSRDFH